MVEKGRKDRGATGKKAEGMEARRGER